jgi:hypothetical protein
MQQVNVCISKQPACAGGVYSVAKQNLPIMMMGVASLIKRHMTVKCYNRLAYGEEKNTARQSIKTMPLQGKAECYAWGYSCTWAQLPDDKNASSPEMLC